MAYFDAKGPLLRYWPFGKQFMAWKMTKRGKNRLVFLMALFVKGCQWNTFYKKGSPNYPGAVQKRFMLRKGPRPELQPFRQTYSSIF